MLLGTLAPFDLWLLEDELARLQLFLLGAHLPELLSQFLQVLVFHNPGLQLLDRPGSVALLLQDDLVFPRLQQLQILGELHHVVHLDKQRSVADSVHRDVGSRLAVVGFVVDKALLERWLFALQPVHILRVVVATLQNGMRVVHAAPPQRVRLGRLAERILSFLNICELTRQIDLGIVEGNASACHGVGALALSQNVVSEADQLLLHLVHLLEGAQLLDLLLLLLHLVGRAEGRLQSTQTIQRGSVRFEGTVGGRNRNVFDADRAVYRREIVLLGFCRLVHFQILGGRGPLFGIWSHLQRAWLLVWVLDGLHLQVGGARVGGT